MYSACLCAADIEYLSGSDQNSQLHYEATIKHLQGKPSKKN